MNLRHLAVAALFSATAAVSQAAVIYDNGPLDASNGNEMSEWIQSEDFALTSTQLLNAIRFFSVDSGLFDGTIVWQIYSDVAGAPGAILFSGSATPTRTAGAATTFGTQYINDFSVGAISLAAGTYHLGLHNGALTNTNREEFYWETAIANTTQVGLENIAPFADNVFSPNGNQHAFQLIGGAAAPAGVPEPETLAMLGIGLVGLALARRRAASVR